MNCCKRIVLFLICLCVGVAAGAGAGDMPHAPRLAAGGGGVVGGFQTGTGEDGTFELFTARMNGDELRSLGRFHGQLAGVAADGDGNCLALTRDGALGRYGDDVEVLAESDSRWNMVGLTWFEGGPVALSLDGRLLRPVRLDADGKWTRDESAVARVGDVTRVDAAVVDGRLCLVWGARANDLSAGALRHAVLTENGWLEEAPLALGDAAAFALAPVPAGAGEESLGVFAILQDVLTGGGRRAVGHAWTDGGWERIPLSDAAAAALAGAFSFAAAGDAEHGAAWLIAGPGGAFFTPAGIEPGGAAMRVGEEGAVRSGDTAHWASLITFCALIVLSVLYCRRSRALSRVFPGRPPDLFSRGAALLLDWFLVSFATGTYHIVNGDIRILPELLLTGDAEIMFWVNLGGLILFTTLCEGLYGRTPGKYLAGLRVRSVLGGRPAFMQAALRNLLRVADMFPLPVAFPGLVGALATLFNRRKQRIGDMVGATVVRRHLPLAERKFLLASASPRRLELLRALGVDVRQEAMDVDEDAVEGEGPGGMAALLARKKMQAAAGSVKPGEVVIAADTVVALGDDVLGKPKDGDEARSMLRRLSGRSHSVFTGVAVWDSLTGQTLSDVEETEVEIRALSDHEIDRYVASGDPMDKAGAYGVQSGFLVSQVRGSLSNVAGLPMEKLQDLLADLDS